MNFTIDLLKTGDALEVMNKSYTTIASNVNIVSTHSIDELTPQIIINYNSSYLSANYAYISALGRYYYIGNKSIEIGKRLLLPLSVDPLMSWRAQILKCPAMITRLEDLGAPTKIPDNKLPVIPNVEEVYPTVAKNPYFEETPSTCYVITLMNGGISP